MTSKGILTRARLAESMLELIQVSGYSGTGVNDVVRHAQAPKGSLYFHYPDGKEGLGAAALDLAVEQFGDLIADAAAKADNPGAALRLAIEVLSDIVSESDFQLGCPVSVVTLEMGAKSDRLREACAAAFQSWITPTAQLLKASGLSEEEAGGLAMVIVSTLEGAVILSRAMRNTQPLEAAANVVERLVGQQADSGEAAR